MVKETVLIYPFAKVKKGKDTEKYYTDLARILSSILCKRYGGLCRDRIFNLILNKRLTIVDIETFYSEIEEDTNLVKNAYHRAESIEGFFYTLIYNIRRFSLKEPSRINLVDFLLCCSDLTVKNSKKMPALESLFDLFITNICTPNSKKNPVVIRVFDSKLLSVIKKSTDFSLTGYLAGYVALVNSYIRLYKQQPLFNFPQIELLHAVYKNAEWVQLSYLYSIFKEENYSNLRKTLDGIDPSDQGALSVVVENLISKSKYVGLSKRAILQELDRVQKHYPYRTYFDENDLNAILRGSNVAKRDHEKFKIKHVFVDYDLFKNNNLPASSEIDADCIGLTSINKIVDLFRNAVLLGNVKSFKQSDIRHIKVTLKRVSIIKTELVEALNSAVTELESIINKKVILEVQYKEEEATRRAGIKKAKNLRIISDIHCDINRGDGYNFDFKDDFIVNCGDTSGDWETTRGWILSNTRRGVFVSGNHLGYNQPHPELNGIQNVETVKNVVHQDNARNRQSYYLNKVFVNSGTTKYLEKATYDYEGITFLGTCLFTNYSLYGEENKKKCMDISKYSLNDFKIPYIFKEVDSIEKAGKGSSPFYFYQECTVRHMEPSDYVNYFKKSFQFLKDTVEEMKHRKLVIVSHFAPLPQSINPMYEGDLLNASFANDLSNFIRENPQIRLWCHGHVHHPVDYIFGETRVVCCPFGYHNENNFKLPDEYGLQIPIRDIRGISSWRRILQEDIEQGRIKVYD